MKLIFAAFVMSALTAPVAFAQTADESAAVNADQSATQADMNYDFHEEFPGRPGHGGEHGPGHDGDHGPGHGGHGPWPGHGGEHHPRPYPPRPYPRPYPPRPYPAPRPAYWTCVDRDAYGYEFYWQDWDLNSARWQAQNVCFRQSRVGGCYEVTCYQN